MWAIDGLANFLPYAGVPLLVALPASLVFRRRRVVMLAAVPLFAWLLVVLIPNLLLTLTPGADADAPRMKVVTANVLMSNDQLPALVADVLAQSPDIVVFEELRHDLELVSPALAAAYPYRLSTETPWVTIASRFPLQDGRRLAIAADDRARDLLAATVEVEGRRVSLIAVHMMPPLNADAYEVTRQQGEVLEAAVHAIDGPLLVVGDFNATTLSPTFATLLVRNGLRIATDSRLLSPTYYTYGRFGVRIDHVLVRDLRVAGDDVFSLTGSDHRGLGVEVALPVSPDERLAAAR